MSGRWDLHEESDAVEDGPVTGLEGYHDLSCAIGAYQATAFEVVFDPARWLYKPEQDEGVWEERTDKQRVVFRG